MKYILTMIRKYNGVSKYDQVVILTTWIWSKVSLLHYTIMMMMTINSHDDQARNQAYASTQVLPHRLAKKTKQKTNQKQTREQDSKLWLNTEVHPYTFI